MTSIGAFHETSYNRTTVGFANTSFLGCSQLSLGTYACVECIQVSFVVAVVVAVRAPIAEGVGKAAVAKELA